MYVAGAEHPNRAPASRFLEGAVDGDFELCTSTEVLQVDPLREKLDQVDPDNLTPREALDLLYELRKI